MESIKLSVIACFLFIFSAWALHSKEPVHSQQVPVAPSPFDSPVIQEKKEEEKKKEEEIVIEPEFNNWPKLRNISDNSLGTILGDIDSHMPAGHVYRDSSKMTWAHETTHGINSNIRNKNVNASKVNGFYCLEDRACVIIEPKTTIRAVAPLVPSVLRGPSYNLYMVQQAGGWNERPLYIFDEWIAYTNGSLCGREMKVSGWYYELLQAHNFNVYAICLAMEVKKSCPDYDDKQMKAFMMWNIERTFEFFTAEAAWEDNLEDLRKLRVSLNLSDGTEIFYGDEKNPTANAMEYVEKLRKDPAADEIRKFCRGYFGVEWCKRVMGF